MSPSNSISYAQFGDNFVRLVITSQRMLQEIRVLLADSIEGEVHKLPADLLTASYRLTINRLTAETPTLAPDPVRFRLGLDGTLDLRVRVLSLPLRFSVQVTIFIDIDVATCAPLTIRLLPRPVDADAVHISVNPHGIPEDLLDKLNIIEPAVAEEIVSEVNRRIAAPELVTATTIDVLALAQQARLAPAPSTGGESAIAA
jgi:hypothetical protein